MVRILVSNTYQSGKRYIEAAGLSTDSKPVGEDILTGSLYLAVDTMTIYAYDETAPGSWGDGAKIGS